MHAGDEFQNMTERAGPGLFRPLLSVVMTLALVILYLIQSALSAEIPTFEAIRSGRAASEAVLLDRFGEPLHETRVDFSERTLSWVSLDDISPNLISAVIRAEDRRFTRHCGVDWRALYRSLWDTALGTRRGGSTISAQVATLALLKKRPQSALGKLKQFQLAAMLERNCTNEELL